MTKKKHAEHVNHERWLVSYADFITLLFAFFVVLFAASQTDKKKQIKLAEAMQSAFTPLGTFDAHSKTPPLTDANASAITDATPAALTPPLPTTSTETPEQTKARLTKLLAEQVAAGHIPPGGMTMRITPDGLVISLHEAGFFPSGSAEVRAAAVPMLSILATTLPAGPAPHRRPHRQRPHPHLAVRQQLGAVHCAIHRHRPSSPRARAHQPRQSLRRRLRRVSSRRHQRHRRRAHPEPPRRHHRPPPICAS